jgi:hypothetical protein
MPNPAINRATTLSAIPCFVPRDVLWYASDTDVLYVGTGVSDNGGSPGVVPISGSVVTSTVSSYDGVATVKAGLPSLVAATTLTSQTAAVSATTVYAVPASKAGLYRVSYAAWITVADAASSVLGGTNGFQTVSTVGGVSTTDSPTTPNISAINTVHTKISGVQVCQCDASTNLQYIFGYTSGTPGVMTYSLNTYVEYLG